MSFHLTRAGLRTLSTRILTAVTVAAAIGSLNPVAFSQKDNKSQTQSGLTNLQRMDVMRQKLEAMRRSLDSAVAAIPAPDASDKTKNAADKTKNADDPRERLRSLSKEVGSVLSDVNDLHAKEDRADKYDSSKLDGLETSVADLNTRVEGALQATAGARKAAADQPATSTQAKQDKGGRRLMGLLPGKKNDKYAELTGSVAAGRDRELFLDATREVRKGNHETGRLLFTTIITTYPDSPYLPMAKLAIADSFYLEGGTSSLIQAGQAYQDWLTYFPTDPLADAAMLKVAQTEMRQMGLPDRTIEHSRKAEQRLKALLQQYPQTKLRPQVEESLRQVQDNLGDHNFAIATFYKDRYIGKHGGLKGAQDRLKEIVEKYPNYCRMDEVLFNYAWTFTVEEEPDEAAKYYQQLVREYPNSSFVEKAKDQLNIIGAGIPEPDQIKKTLAPCAKPGFVGNMMQQISGNANVTTSNDGILITKHGDGTDLIDKAIQNNGQVSEGDIKVYEQNAPTDKQSNKPAVTSPQTKSNNTTNDSSTASRPRSTQSPTPKP
ncbi:MAG TPA: outer membrane protein assembly factor BamD [Pyrinomonadaceae bacterium]|nr:outer membrane protein assembly factor BamD [Pyrinomonadaceae bacterium]